MYWRDRSLPHGEPKKRAMEKLVRRGPAPGLLAYDASVAVGWVSVAPRAGHPPLLASPRYRPRDGGGGAEVWSIVCFTVDKDERGRGVAPVLLDAAVAHAFTEGATSVEAYPHASDRRDYMGHVELFERAGFAGVRDAGKRAIVRRER